MTFVVPTLFGLEGLAADELRRLDIQNVRAENGRVYFDGAEREMAVSNLALSCGERVLLLLGTFRAQTFDELFEGVRALPLQDFIPRGGAFPVTGYSRSSKLTSIPDCQKIIKKAAAVKLASAFGMNISSGSQLPEDGAVYQIRFALADDTAEIYLDTSGEGLHKRGYRPKSVGAPLRETLAAGIVRVARYRGRERFRDPFCGSGTIIIEAALAAKNRAPGLNRKFASEAWDTIKTDWQGVREALKSREFGGSYDILGSDIDPAAVSLARENAQRAGVSDIVRFEVSDARNFGSREREGSGILAANPPYGQRLEDTAAAAQLYREFGASVKEAAGFSMYILSSHTEFEREFGRRADKKRKLYNGMIKCDLFIYK